MQELLKIKNTAVLEAYGDIATIKLQLKPYLPPSAQLDARCYQTLLEDIDWIRQHYTSQAQAFTSEKQEYLYYLLEHSNGKERKAKLQTDDVFYQPEGAKAARQWRNRIGHILRADLNDSQRSQQAFIRLNEMYYEMTQLDVGDNDEEPLIEWYQDSQNKED